MAKSTSFSTNLVEKIANLAAIPITQGEEQAFATAFTETIAVIDNLQQVDTTGVEPTAHATGAENVLREDSIGKESFTQEQALQNAQRSLDGFFVVPQIVNHDK